MSVVRARPEKSKAMMLAGFAGSTAALALVIWIKLRVVTTIPKQAYADPDTQVREPAETEHEAHANAKVNGH